ncbi:MAG: autotransporter outer membrane beta-barrel domain-containing protein [Alphaproteobacteria bacterium]|nr:autotransporter outer membrane beta-barrel domain-containing protein [Alphaproteobacteria bacterium]
MRRLLVLIVVAEIFFAANAGAEIIDSPEYIGKTGSAVSIGRGQEWSAQNATFRDNSSNFGGAIRNMGTFSLEGYNSFTGNKSFTWGGAIENYNIVKLFGSNEFKENTSAYYGGAIFSPGYVIIEPREEGHENIFEGNKSEQGGAIAQMEETLYVNKAKFTNNRAEITDTFEGEVNEKNHWGGALLANGDKHFILNSEFRGNHAYAGGAILTGFAQGMAGTPDTKFGGLRLYNTSFYDNKAVDNGGAITASAATIIAAGENGVSEFKGNGLDNGKSEAIYMTNKYVETEDDMTPKLVLKTYNGGQIKIYDDIDGEDYDIEISGNVTDNLTDEVIDEEIKEEVGDVLAGVKGDGNGEVHLFGKVDNVTNFNVLTGSTVHLGHDAVINTKNYKSDNATLKLDVAANTADKTLQSGIINVSGDVEGNTNVIVNLETPDFDKGAAIKFLEAPNDDMVTLASFNISRVIGSPYIWNSEVNHEGEITGNHWYLTLGDEKNPDYEEPDNEDKPEIDIPHAPEIAAFVGVQRMAIEQNRSIADSVLKGLAFTQKTDCSNRYCGRYKVLPRKQAWVHTLYENADIKAPSDMDAKINGVTAGIDVYRTNSDRIGVFGAYRDGEYDFSGRGKYYSPLSSDVKNESWLGGLYYKRSCNSWLVLATLFAGEQNIDISTEDKIAFADTEAMQYGMSASLGKEFLLGRHWNFIPEISLFYSVIDIDDVYDNVGKGMEFDTLRYAEAEFGTKFEYRFCTNGCSNRVYIKPSIIRTFASGNHSRLLTKTGSEKIKTYDGQTLGRAEFGGEFGISSRFLGYARGRYTFGDDYNAYDVLLGLNYRF